MKKPEIKIYQPYSASEVHYVRINGDSKYKCITRERAEAFEEMLDALIEARKAIESIPKHDLGFTYTGGGNRVDDPPEGYPNKEALLHAIDQALKKAGCKE